MGNTVLNVGEKQELSGKKNCLKSKVSLILSKADSLIVIFRQALYDNQTYF